MINIDARRGTALMAAFVAHGAPPAAALEAAAGAVRDTVGVIFAGVTEPAARMAQAMAVEEGRGPSRMLGTSETAGPGMAALANGVAAHAIDFDDMCFVSIAHPSCALVPAALAAAEVARAPGRVLLEGYVLGFEIECRLGQVMNPRHYHERGWHATSSIGTVGAAAAAAHVLGLTPDQAGHALGIAASAACGLKENFGSMVKPLHAGMAARNGLMAATLARKGFTASARALDGPAGFLKAMDSERPGLDEAAASLGSHWEIVASGITVKLYPSCAATHPSLDTILDLRRREGFTADDVDAVDVEVDSMAPGLLTYARPATGLEGKFSMPFCAAAAIAYGRVGIDTFEIETIRKPEIQRLLPRVTLRTNTAFDSTTPLSHARVTIRLRDGRVLTQSADGARGYPARPASDEELRAKFSQCARRILPQPAADHAWAALTRIEHVADISELTGLLGAG